MGDTNGSSGGNGVNRVITGLLAGLTILAGTTACVIPLYMGVNDNSAQMNQFMSVGIDLMKTLRERELAESKHTGTIDEKVSALTDMNQHRDVQLRDLEDRIDTDLKEAVSRQRTNEILIAKLEEQVSQLQEHVRAEMTTDVAERMAEKYTRPVTVEQGRALLEESQKQQEAK
jgi:hypothetical protein